MLKMIKSMKKTEHLLQKELAFLILHCIENLHNSYIHFTNNFFIKIYFFTKLFYSFLPSFYIYFECINMGGVPSCTANIHLFDRKVYFLS